MPCLRVDPAPPSCLKPAYDSTSSLNAYDTSARLSPAQQCTAFLTPLRELAIALTAVARAHRLEHHRLASECRSTDHSALGGVWWLWRNGKSRNTPWTDVRGPRSSHVLSGVQNQLYPAEYAPSCGRLAGTAYTGLGVAAALTGGADA